MTDPSPNHFDPNSTVDYFVDRIVRNETFINAIEGVVEVKTKEAFKSEEFVSAVEGIVENELDEAFHKFKNEVFDEYMGGILHELQTINSRLEDVDGRLADLESQQ
ncbi:MAG: hypothetical protein OXI80_22005 [Caldilineaceae bacterium]|nr:hypothetical protein [Caldilineaceae bacterium]MDE0340357.1 hypothetical protein [Caldilineaceae bacterium]